MTETQEFFRHIESVLQKLSGASVSDQKRVTETYALLSQFFVLASAEEPLHFTTLFARISHVSNRQKVPVRNVRAIHQFRILAEVFQRKGIFEPTESVDDIWTAAAYALHDTASRILQIPKSQTTEALIGRKQPAIEWKKPRMKGFKRYARLVAHEVDLENSLLRVSDPDSTEIQTILMFGETGRSELYTENVIQACEILGLPFSLSAIDIEIDADGRYSPRMIVIEPDYLIDISMIAECYQESGGDVRLYLPKKFQETRSTPSLLVGKIANFFLDELIHDPDVPFDKLFPRTFFLNPIEFATLSDEDVWKMMKDCEGHYHNLRRVILEEFEKVGLYRDKMTIEPAFFCPAFGIQGRLDLFQSTESQKDIIELKSGQAFMANAYGLSSSHYAQTLLYDLMIKAVYDFKPRQTCYILYSKLNERTLRYAPPVEAIQREVIRLRNDMLLVEGALGRQEAHKAGWFERIRPEFFPDVKGFMIQDITAFGEVWEGLDNLEKQYVRIFSRFIANEHYLAKVGMHGSDQVHGLAGLWLDTEAEKEERFDIFRNLKVRSIEMQSDHVSKDAYVSLYRDPPTDALVNFRIGDIAVLYPDLDRIPAILKTQIYKCTVTSLGKNEVVVRLRSRQVSYDDIRQHERWTLEHDLYDRSFNTMHSALFTFAKYPEDRRALFLGRMPPAKEPLVAQVNGIGIEGTQQALLERIIRARDYFLLWGPPGTGKTSIILHHLVKHYLTHTSDRIVLLAYTNRAVDEICQALDAIGGNIRDSYMRIGSHIGTGQEFTGQLVGNKIKGMKTRKEVIALIQSQRIIVGTISSFSGKPELFKIIRADLVIVDEASQILEPMLGGILPAFKKWILIGDHRQLPAVVVQAREQTMLKSDAITEIALEDTRDSYFERMFTLCRINGWDWSYGSLIHQGRMHAEIMAFPGQVFYDGQLALLERKHWNGRDFTGMLQTQCPPEPGTLEQVLATKRMIWFPSTPRTELWNSKTHDHEAEMIVEILKTLSKLYHDLPSIGIVTPFRAQIANIRQKLLEHELDPDLLTIDTVERYQGSARDIIILSLSIHKPYQLNQIVSLSREEVDRKLNVAITRAREQFILLASEDAIRLSKTYLALAEACYKMTITATIQV